MDYCEAFPPLFMVRTAREVSETDAVPIRHKFRESESACVSLSSIYNHKFLFKKCLKTQDELFYGYCDSDCWEWLCQRRTARCAHFGVHQKGKDSQRLRYKTGWLAVLDFRLGVNTTFGVFCFCAPANWIFCFLCMQILSPGICAESELHLPRKLPERLWP